MITIIIAIHDKEGNSGLWCEWVMSMSAKLEQIKSENKKK